MITLNVPVVLHAVQSSDRHTCRQTDAQLQDWLSQVNPVWKTADLTFWVRNVVRTRVSEDLIGRFATHPPKGPSPLHEALVDCGNFDPTSLNVYFIRDWPGAPMTFPRYRAAVVADHGHVEVGHLGLQLAYLLGVKTRGEPLLQKFSMRSRLDAVEIAAARGGAERILAGPVSLPTVTVPHPFLPRFSTPHRMVSLQTSAGVVAAASGSAPWYDDELPSHRTLLTYPERVPTVETDALELVGATLDGRYAAANEFLVYQHWGVPDARGVRAYHPMDIAAMERLAQTLRGGPTRRLALVVTSFEFGALARFADAFAPHTLEMMGLFLALSGDSVNNSPSLSAEIGHCAVRLGLQRLSVLSTAYDEGWEARLLDAVRGSQLRIVQIHRRDEAGRYPLLLTPAIRDWLAR